MTEPSRIRYDACIVIPDGATVDGGVGIQVLPGGEHAVAVNRGPLERLPTVYVEIMGTWLPSRGRETGRGSPYEIYRTNPETSPADQQIIEVRVPLA